MPLIEFGVVRAITAKEQIVQHDIFWAYRSVFRVYLQRNNITYRKSIYSSVYVEWQHIKHRHLWNDVTLRGLSLIIVLQLIHLNIKNRSRRKLVKGYSKIRIFPHNYFISQPIPKSLHLRTVLSKSILQTPQEPSTIIILFRITVRTHLQTKKET